MFTISVQAFFNALFERKQMDITNRQALVKWDKSWDSIGFVVRDQRLQINIANLNPK